MVERVYYIFQAINTLRNSTDRSKFTFETFGQTMLLEADPSILTPLTLSASSIATLGSNNVPPLGGERESVCITRFIASALMNVALKLFIAPALINMVQS